MRWEHIEKSNDEVEMGRCEGQMMALSLDPLPPLGVGSYGTTEHSASLWVVTH